MDTLTHAISGAVIGAATSMKDAREMRRRALWGALFAAFPDSDFVIAFFTDHFTYLNEHRGYTHSILLLPLWAAALGAIAARISRVPWRAMAALAAAALAAHILGDLITSYGTKVFKPLYDAPLAIPITFIIDPVFTGILLTGLIRALRKTAPKEATAFGLVLVSYLLLQVVCQQWAMRAGAAYAEALGEPDAAVIVFPQPLSLLNWKVVVVHGGVYHRAYINLLKQAPSSAATEDPGIITKLRAAYQPVDLPRWQAIHRWPRDEELRELAMAAWAQEQIAGFRQFALLPYVTAIRGDENSLCVWFTDLRFTLPGLDSPFEYAMCRDAAGQWTLAPDDLKPEQP